MKNWDLSSVIVSEIKKQGCKQAELSKLSGVAQGSISMLISGKRSLVLENASKLCKVLGLVLKGKI